VCLLTDIAVHPNYRGQGIASQIINALLDEVKDCEKVFAHTSQANGLYEKLGFSDFDGGTMELLTSF
jgi:N-acetylglutamate synthase-like GNAT family acetyltransferase